MSSSMSVSNRSWRQAPDVGKVVKSDRCAEEDVVVLDVVGGACFVGLPQLVALGAPATPNFFF